jgi:ADP-ribose pyrophosphatase YjhB (NUDIX family)
VIKNPCAPTGKTGPFRYAPDGNHHEPVFGQIEMADAVLFCTCVGTRYLLLIQRSDGHGHALPGGHIDPGDGGDAITAAVRELEEETGFQVAGLADEPRALPTRHVPDPRETDDAWAVTTPVVLDIGDMNWLPMVKAGDDASAALWAFAPSYDRMVHDLERLGCRVFEAHKGLLRELLDG